MNPTSESSASHAIVYLEPPKGQLEARKLIAVGGPEPGRTFTFYEKLQIGRFMPDAPPGPGYLSLADPTVSSKHCVITQDDRGRCFVRDWSRNGTWIDGRRLVPGAETRIMPGQEISLGQGHVFRLHGKALELPPEGEAVEDRVQARGVTDSVSPLIDATVVVGDVRGYTSLVSETPAEILQASMNALFQALEETAAENGGTVKEYPGDAMLAYWESGGSRNSAVRACRATVALHERARRLASDERVWMLPERPLRMDWALASGPVTVRRLGGDRPIGLSLIGEAVVKAYRIEKVAGDETGSILVCSKTRELAAGEFLFMDLGEKELQGFSRPEKIYALLGVR